MKKVWLLITVLVLYGLYGCGGGSSDITETQQPVVQPSGSNGSVVVNITDSDMTDAIKAAAVPTATNVRLVITNNSIRMSDTNAAFKMIVDGAFPSGGKVTGLQFPVATGYVFELISYVPVGTPPTVNRMVKYAKASNVSISSTATTTVTLSLQPIVATFALPASVYSGATMNVTATFVSQPTPLSQAWNLFLQDTTPFSQVMHSTATSSSVHSIRAPYVSTPGLVLYAQGEFYINNYFLNTTGALNILDSTDTTKTFVPPLSENYHNWTFNYPDPGVPDPSVSTTLTLVPVEIPATP